MSEFYLKAKIDYTTGGEWPVKFIKGHFYEVDHAADGKVHVGNGDAAVSFTDAEVDQYFERHKGSFVNLVADRVIFYEAARFTVDILNRHTRIARGALSAPLLIMEVHHHIKRLFKSQKRPQPDTPVAGWQLTLIDHGKFCNSLGDVINKWVAESGGKPVELGDVTLSFNFPTDKSVTHVYSVTEKATFVLPD